MRRKIIFFVLFSLFLVEAFSQETKSGYNLRFSLDRINEKTLYLSEIYGNSSFIIDSAKVKGHKNVVFKSKNRVLPDGIYRLTDKEGKIFLTFLIEHSRDFSISFSKNGVSPKIEGSDENIVFFEFQKRIAQREDLEYLILLTENTPNSLLSLFINAEYMDLDIPELYLENGTRDTLGEYSYIIEHYFDNLPLSDSRILRIPIQDGVDYFFSKVLVQQPDILIDKIKKFIDKTDGNEEVKQYYLKLLYHLFNDGNSLYDPILIYLFDNYCPNKQCEWLEDYMSRRFYRDVERKRKTLPGAIIPFLEAYDINKELISTKDIDKQYTILWFWDPDCDDCLELTPELYQFYETYKTLYNFEVYAVSVTEDFDRWKKFITDSDLNWINVSFAMGDPNYDFVDYFDLLMTPGIYIIDKNHKIIARQFPLDELHEKFENN